MRVLHVGKFYWPHTGGIETYLRQLVQGHKEFMDIEVVVANDRPLTVEERSNAVRVTRVGSLGVVASTPICPTLMRHLQGRRPDLIHLHAPNPGAMAAYAVTRPHGALVISHHGDVLGRKILRRMADPFARYAMARAKAIIVGTHAYLESSLELRPYRAKCHVIPYGVDVNEYTEPDDRQVRLIREEVAAPIILTVGRLVPYKGLEYLIQAMETVAAVLVIIGDGPLRPTLEKRARDIGVQNRVKFLGRVTDIRRYLHATDLFVLPSVTRAESFGIVQLEAMACGKPVVNTSIDSGVPTVSINGVTGLTVPPRCPKSLANAINTLLNNPELRSRFGAAALKRVHTEFTLDLMVRRTAQLYSEVVQTAGITDAQGGQNK